MTDPSWALGPGLALGVFALWTIALALAVAGWRGVFVARRQMKVNQIPSGTEHGPARYWRLNRAHINASENLSVFAAVALLTAFTGVTDAIVGLAWIVVTARIAQTTIHVASNAPRAVLARAAAFATQLVALALMVLAALGQLV